MSKKFMKKTLAGIFALVIVASSTPITPFVTVMDSNSITVNAASPADDFVFDSGTITGYTGEGGDVEIPSTIGGVGVTSIGESAFDSCASLVSVTIPEGVTSIGDDAFLECSNLTSVTIPESVTSIGDFAFAYCSNLASVTIPEGVTSIGGYAFYVCKNLASVTIPEGVTSIGNNAFHSCSGLTSITLPKSLESIGSEAFKNCSAMKTVNYTGSTSDWKRIMIDSSNNERLQAANITYDYVPPAPESDFNYDINSLLNVVRINGYKGKGGDVVIPSEINGRAVAMIWFNAFLDCTSLTSITIPDSVTDISVRAFEGCTSLTSVTIPDSVTDISGSAFKGCTSLTSITIPDSIETINDGVFSGCTSLTSVTIPDSVTSIGASAFSGCTSLTSITIPDSVTSIGASAFSGCTSLTSITIPDSVTSISNAFMGCTSLTSITIPDSVTSISNAAFEGCTSLTSITIPDSVTSIGQWVFDGCTSLTSVTIPDSVTSIGYYNFADCTSLTSITAPCALKESMGGAVDNCTATITYTHPCTKSEEDTYKVKCACGDTKLDYMDVFVLLTNEEDFLKNVNSNDYTEDSWKAFEDSAKALAEIVSDFTENVFVSAQSELTDAISAYTTAKTALVLKDADYTAVNDAIDNVPDDLSIYTAESVNALNNALNDVVYDLDITRQNEVDAMAQAIEDAIDGLKELADTSRLEAAIADADAANEADYADDVWLDIQEKVAEGNTYVGAGLAADDVQGDVDAVTDELNALLLQKLNDADYTAVDAAIANIPDDLSIYTDASVDALIAAYKNVVRDLKEDKQGDVDAMAKAIEDAIDGLVLKDADYTEVDKYIAQAANIDRSLYTDASLTDLDAALAAVVHDLDITRQDEVTGYANDIYAAIAALEEKPKYDTLYEEYLVKAPTVTENGTYNKRAYHYENDAKVVDTEKVFAEDKAVTFEQWYLRTLIQYQTNGTEFDLRFVSMLDENLDQYQKAGFIFTINGTEVSDELSTVTANTSYIVDGSKVDISAFSQPDDYFFLQKYAFDIGEIDLDATLAVKAYVVLADGTELQGTKAVTFTLRQFEG